MRISPHSWTRRASHSSGRRPKGTKRSRPLLAIVTVFATTLGIGAGSLGASTRSIPMNVVPAHLLATRITVTVAKSPIKIGQQTIITAKLRPQVAGRSVLLRRHQRDRFVNIGRATTNQRGIATFRQTFRTQGKVLLRATVSATSIYQSATSVTAIENVVIEYPFVLAPGIELRPGDSGSNVLILQQRLSALGYWLGTPGGYFGDLTEQAVFALEKASGISRSGIVGPQFVTALNARTRPVARSVSGNAIEVDLTRSLVMFFRDGSLQYILNTSTGGGYTYKSGGSTAVAATPRGVFRIERVVNGLDVGPLGALWRPRYFYSGFAIHGSDSVPPYPVSHGCVRVSNRAMDWIWTTNLAPIGSKVMVY